MSTDKTIKNAVEKIKGLLPANLQDMVPEKQIHYLEIARHQIDGISWLLVADGRWHKPIGAWVKAQLDELDAQLHQLQGANIDALLTKVESELQVHGGHHEAA